MTACWRLLVQVGRIKYRPIVKATSEQDARAKAAVIYRGGVVLGTLELHPHDVHDRWGRMASDQRAVIATLHRDIPEAVQVVEAEPVQRRRRQRRAA
jgi:hypothetical protein